MASIPKVENERWDVAWRRVALYGVDFLLADKNREKEELDNRHSTEDVIRLREVLSEQIGSLKELKEMASRYGHDPCLCEQACAD